ncbi:MAG: flagellar biosynthetic protein FliO [Planctomycetes bacterium]|nr:flagellar biosynthetic protein FliO [Planctomycetota bacterium]
MLLALSQESSRFAASSGPDLTRYLLVCGGLIALVGGLGYLFKRFFAGRLKARAAQRSLQVIDMLPLGGKQKLVVVRCYDRTFALGLGDKEVGLIAELDAVIKPAHEPAPTKADAAGFKAILEDMRKRGELEPAPRGAAPATRAAPAKPAPRTTTTELYG